MAKKLPLDIYDDMPRDMRAYLQNYGWHFNGRAVKLAVGMMKKKNPATGKTENLEPYSKDKVDEILSKHNVKLEKAEGQDYVYVCNKALTRCNKSSVPDEQHLALYVKDIIDDPFLPDGAVMREWYAAYIVGGGEFLDWEEIL